MSVKFSVQMTEKYMYDFLLYSYYTRFSGLFSTIVGVFCLGNGITLLMNESMSQSLIWIFLAIFLLVMTPINMKSKAKLQVTQSEMFKNPLEYELNDEGVVIRQDEQEARVTWDEMMKAVSTQKSVILYITKIRAIILPKECMGEMYEEAIKAIHTHMPPKKVKIRHIH